MNANLCSSWKSFGLLKPVIATEEEASTSVYGAYVGRAVGAGVGRAVVGAGVGRAVVGAGEGLGEGRSVGPGVEDGLDGVDGEGMLVHESHGVPTQLPL